MADTLRILIPTVEDADWGSVLSLADQACARALADVGVAADQPTYVGVHTEPVTVDGTVINTDGLTIHAFEVTANRAA